MGQNWTQYAINAYPKWSADDVDLVAKAEAGNLDAMGAAILLAERKLPGWLWRVATCSVSDDAWIFPDFNHPSFGAAFQERYPDEAQRNPVEWFGTDIDQRPPGKPAVALINAIFLGLQKV